MPPIPNNFQQVAVEGQWAETWDGGLFLSKRNALHEFLVFTTEDNIRKLAQCRQIFMDGTFKTCPAPFVQFVTIHGFYMERALPFVMVLMTGKTEEMYKAVLRHIKRRVQHVTGQRWMPNKVTTDFEMAMMEALRTELPTVRSSGCYFHFCQSLWRKVQELGLSAPYRTNRRIKKWIRKAMAVGYLPLAVMRHNFRLMITSRLTRQLLRAYPQLGDFIQYMERTYVRDNAIFPPAVWNVFARGSDNRTNNRVEAFHRRWNALMQRRHPSLWVFIRRLKDEQRRTEGQCVMAERGDPAPRQRRKWRHLEARLQRLRREYRRGDRTLDEYWLAVQHSIQVSIVPESYQYQRRVNPAYSAPSTRPERALAMSGKDVPRSTNPTASYL
ncbi:hypothetical protein WMY93_027832 [Mugilogobius chulae]|uniref:MULE transposase domain-containing protein n=1 Tax=Mugilogobius chulae TaxID=88201 RepID=A0AAW0MU49_9GOBI